MLALILLALAGPAAANPAPPIRHMVFTAHIEGDGHASAPMRGANAGEADPGGSTYGSVGQNGRVSETMTIDVDVMGALDDGSLVVRVTESGKDAAAPAQLGITKDGDLISIDGDGVSVEAAPLLRLLARNFVVGHDVDPGSSWTLPFGPERSGTMHVSVSASDGAHLALDLRGESFLTNPAIRRQRMTGQVTYDSAHTVPLNASVDESISVEDGTEIDSGNYQMRYTLESDSLGGS